MIFRSLDPVAVAVTCAAGIAPAQGHNQPTRDVREKLAAYLQGRRQYRVAVKAGLSGLAVREKFCSVVWRTNIVVSMGARWVGLHDRGKSLGETPIRCWTAAGKGNSYRPVQKTTATRELSPPRPRAGIGVGVEEHRFTQAASDDSVPSRPRYIR